MLSYTPGTNLSWRNDFMPGAFHHRSITRQALASAGITDAGKLAEDYCIYPDCFHSRYEEISPYLFIMDKVEFHYIPHTPVDEFYRYWDHIPGEGTRMLSTLENRNLRFTEAGFKFYLEKSVAALRSGEREEAWKFLGCLLHFLEDSVFGVHALEGTDGTDIYVLDRLTGKDVAKYICSIPLNEELLSLQVTPQIFAFDISEAVAILYAKQAKAAASSRQALFDMALGFITGNPSRDVRAGEKVMFLNALQLAADTIATTLAIAEQRAVPSPRRELAEFEPFHYPIGGGGSFQLRKYSVSSNTISFGVNLEARLLYHLPEKSYSRFTALLCGRDAGGAEVEIINHGRTVKSFTIDTNTPVPVEIPEPGGVFGFITRAGRGKGELSVADGILHR